jgi:hypothetical protein
MFEDLLSLVTGGLDKIFEDLYQSATGKIKKKITEKLSVKKIEGLLDNISQIGKVKTIFNPNSIVDLDEVYFGGAITFSALGVVNSLGTFNANKILIEGAPGQGKSLYLKHLCIEESKKRIVHTCLCRVPQSRL